ncbi:MAG: helix-turn-helix domain-containing protein [Actinomycetota bacterium]
MDVGSLHQLTTLIKARRAELGLTQAQLAERAGVSRWWVGGIEAGRARAELALVLRVLDALELRLMITPRESRRAPGTGFVKAIDLDEIIDDYRRS